MNCNKMRQFKKVFTHLVLINKSLIAFPLDIEASFSLGYRGRLFTLQFRESHNINRFNRVSIELKLAS